jgi:hypothetical protein
MRCAFRTTIRATLLTRCHPVTPAATAEAVPAAAPIAPECCVATTILSATVLPTTLRTSAFPPAFGALRCVGWLVLARGGATRVF